MEEKKIIKTKKELEMEQGGKKEVKMEKEVKTAGEEVPVKKEETIEEKEVPVEKEEETTTETETSDVEKSLEKGRNTAQKIFEDMISTFRDKQGDFEKAMSEYTASSAKMATDVIETDNELVVKTDLPGVKKEDIVIDLSEDMLEIMAIFEDEAEFKGDNFIKKERRYGEAKRKVTITQPIKMEEAKAKFDNGVLTVTIPKQEKKRQQLKLE
ncbi:MAG: Hsp20/alpha crystallin family protein [Methanobacterium sp.]